MKKALYFLLGAAAGSLTTWLLLKNKYCNNENDEISWAEWKEVSRGKTEKFEEEPKKKETTASTRETSSIRSDMMRDAADYIRYNGYWETAKQYEDRANKPYVIKPEEFGENSEYSQITLTYYSDGVLADDNDEMLDDDAGQIVGTDFMDHFGEFEEDSVFIRNDRRKTDYEIVRANEVYPYSPYSTEEDWRSE